MSHICQKALFIIWLLSYTYELANRRLSPNGRQSQFRPGKAGKLPLQDHRLRCFPEMVQRLHVQDLLRTLPQQRFGLTKDGRPPRLSGVHSLPSIKAENMHARGFSAMAKQSFQNDRLGKNEFGLSSTGFNLNREALIDRSKAASSSKYGKSEIQRAHPGWNAPWGSTADHAFKNPAEQVNPTYRPTEKWLQTQKASTKTSGFATNNGYQDGHGWKPNPVLKGDMNRTEYRDRFNADHPFHRNPNVSIPPNLKKTQLNYRFN